MSTLTPGTKNEVVGAIVADEGIPFYWCLVAVNMETRTVNRLLHAIVELWVTIRGFSFCSGWMELYNKKQNHFNVPRDYTRHCSLAIPNDNGV